jgi:hypothetical protein
MAGKTRHFGLAYFDYKDRLDTSISVKLERDRFITIDEQLFGLYGIFGNGIVSGFRISRTQTQSGVSALSVEPGVLFCRNRSFESIDVEVISGLPANGEYYVYADLIPDSAGGKNLAIYTSRSDSDSNAIRLARIVAFNGEVSNIDFSYRNEISFKRIVQNAVANHKHNGTVSKIDLLKEVKSTLPGARLGEIDASKVKYGTFKRERIPQLNHNSLKNKGIVSHAGLETLARSLQNVNRQLLGEVSSVNLMKQSLLLKRKYPEDESTGVNMITFIPGISSDSVIDFANSSANINLQSNCISGRRSSGGRQVSVKYSGTQALNNYSFIKDCSVSNDKVFLNSTISSSSVQFADGFENASGTDKPFPGTSAKAEVVDNKIAIRSDGFNVVSGLFSARFTSGKKDKSVYTRSVSQQKNWTAFNKLFLSVKCSQSPHPAVLFYLSNRNADGTISYSEKTQILAPDEVTSNPESNNFKLVEIEITDYVKNNIEELIFEVVDAGPEFIFYADDIKTASVASSETKYASSGSVRYRHVAPYQVTLEAIVFDVNEENNTDVECRFRTGSDIIELLNSSFSSPIESNSALEVPCNAVEVEFTLKTNPSQTATPSVSNISLIFLIQGGERRVELDALEEWSQGVFKNVEIFSEGGDAKHGIRIKTPLENNHIVYSSNNYVQQIKNALPGIPASEANASIFGYNGSQLLQSPQQVVSSTTNNPASGIDQASYVQRLSNRNYLISDTFNHRVIEVDREGSLVMGFGGSYVVENASQGDFIPLCANLNTEKRLLQICFDKNIESRDEIDIGFISIVVGQTVLNMGDLDANSNDNAPKNVVQIKLSEQKNQIIKDANIPVFVKLDPRAIGQENFNTESPIYSNSYGINGLRLTKSNFTYIKDIFHPIAAISYDDSNWVIGNSLIRFDRIRAGLREDVDEFFIPKGTESSFFVVATLSEELQNLDTQVVFLNDPDATQSSGDQYEDVIVTNGNNVAFDGEISVSTQSKISARVKVTPSQNMTGLNFNFIFKVAVKVFDAVLNRYVPVAGSPFRIEKRIHVIAQATTEGSDQAPDLSSVIKINIKNSQIDFSFGKVDQFTFSDFTLGGIYKISENEILVGGIYKLPEELQFETSPPNDDGFRAQAFQKLKFYRGKVYKIDPNNGAVSFNYDSPDGLFVSDCSRTSEGEILIAESSIIQNSGRTIKIDEFGNINFVLSNSQLSVINHARESGPGKIIIST